MCPYNGVKRTEVELGWKQELKSAGAISGTWDSELVQSIETQTINNIVN